jgi:hypothetical protein
VTEEQDKQAMIGLMEREWHSFDALLRSFDDRQLDQPVFGEGPGWRVRDLLTHIAWWQDLAAQAAEKMVQEGGAPTLSARRYLGIERSADDLNREAFEAWKDRPMAERWDRWLGAHSRMMDAIRALTPDQLLQAEGGMEGMRLAFGMPGLVHLRRHREHLEAALKETPKP